MKWKDTTRDGHKVRIYADGSDTVENRVHGAWVSKVDNAWQNTSWTSDGKSDCINDFDLIPDEPEKPVVDWSVIPPWLKWVAMDKTGCWWAYEIQPYIATRSMWYATLFRMSIHDDYAPKFSGDWKDSLVERPQ